MSPAALRDRTVRRLIEDHRRLAEVVDFAAHDHEGEQLELEVHFARTFELQPFTTETSR